MVLQNAATGNGSVQVSLRTNLLSLVDASELALFQLRSA